MRSSIRETGTVDGYTHLVAPGGAVVEDRAAPGSGALRVIAPYSESADGPR